MCESISTGHLFHILNWIISGTIYAILVGIRYSQIAIVDYPQYPLIYHIYQVFGSVALVVIAMRHLRAYIHILCSLLDFIKQEIFAKAIICCRYWIHVIFVMILVLPSFIVLLSMMNKSLNERESIIHAHKQLIAIFLWVLMQYLSIYHF